MTATNSLPKVRRQGKHGPPPGFKPSPRSLANLRPWQPGVKHPGNGGETVTHSLKDILREFDKEKHNARIIAEKMVERAKILTGKSDAAILAQLLDRTEGRVAGDEEKTINNRVTNFVFILPDGTQVSPVALIEVKKQVGNSNNRD